MIFLHYTYADFTQCCALIKSFEIHHGDLIGDIVLTINRSFDLPNYVPDEIIKISFKDYPLQKFIVSKSDIYSVMVVDAIGLKRLLEKDREENERTIKEEKAAELLAKAWEASGYCSRAFNKALSRVLRDIKAKKKES